jgi:hypothetical protein
MSTLSATAFHKGKTLAEGELGPETDRCPTCRLTAPRRDVVRAQTGPDVWFRQCPQCHGVSASRMPTPQALNDYYARYYDRALTELITTPKPERLARRIASHWSAPPRDRIGILDFGGGDGTISVLVAGMLVASRKARHVDILVVDYVSDNPRVPPAGVTLRFAADLDIGKVEGQHDIIIASAILEHIPDFTTAFDGLMARAAPGALFYARTPSMTPLARLVPLDLTFPAHVHDLGGAFWAALAQRLGSTVTVLRHAPSIIETVLSSNLIRTLAAFCLKAPAHLLRHLGLPHLWPYVGGWEVIWRIDPDGSSRNS